MAQVFKGGHRLKGMTTCLKCGLITLSFFLLLHTFPISFLSPCPDGDVGVVFVQRLSGHKHVTVSAAGVGLVTLLQNHNRFLHVAVHEVNLGVRTAHLLALSSLNRALQQPLHILRGYMIELGVHHRWVILTLCPPSNRVLVLSVCRQLPIHKFCRSIWAVDTLLVAGLLI